MATKILINGFTNSVSNIGIVVTERLALKQANYAHFHAFSYPIFLYGYFGIFGTGGGKTAYCFRAN